MLARRSPPDANFLRSASEPTPSSLLQQSQDATYRHVYHLYEIEVVDEADRNTLLTYLNDAGVDAKTHYSIAIHEQEGFSWGKSARLVGPLTNAEQNAHSCISLPMFPELTQEEQDEVIRLLRAWKA